MHACALRWATCQLHICTADAELMGCFLRRLSWLFLSIAIQLFISLALSHGVTRRCIHYVTIGGYTGVDTITALKEISWQQQTTSNELNSCAYADRYTCTLLCVLCVCVCVCVCARARARARVTYIHIDSRIACADKTVSNTQLAVQYYA